MYYKGTSNVKCPYYIREARLSMTCEGFFSDEVVFRFNNEKEKETYQEENCFMYPSGCLICSQNDKKYAEKP